MVARDRSLYNWAMAQVVVLVLLAQVAGAGGPMGVTSMEVGRFLSMESCRDSAARAVAVHPSAEIKVSYLCVPLTSSAK